MKKEISRLLEHQERLIETVEELTKKLSVLDEKIKKLEGLDLVKYLKDENEIDEVIDQRIANLLEIANKLRTLNQYKQEAIIEYLAKRSGTTKTNLRKVIGVFEEYLEKLL